MVHDYRLGARYPGGDQAGRGAPVTQDEMRENYLAAMMPPWVRLSAVRIPGGFICMAATQTLKTLVLPCRCEGENCGGWVIEHYQVDEGRA